MIEIEGGRTKELSAACDMDHAASEVCVVRNQVGERGLCFSDPFEPQRRTKWIFEGEGDFGGVGGVYNRYQYVNETKAGFIAYADFLAKIVK